MHNERLKKKVKVKLFFYVEFKEKIFKQRAKNRKGRRKGSLF